MKRYIIADIHGHYDAMIEAIERSPFDPDEDLLISLGDIVDGGRQTRQCIDYMLTLPNHIAIKGNHDYPWFYDWTITGFELPLWVHQGGYATMESYGYDRRNVPKEHIDYIENALPFWIDACNNIYVHGGFDPRFDIRNQDIHEIMWNRKLFQYARRKLVPGYNKVFIGHTTVQVIKGKHKGKFKPITFNNLTMCDTGGGWNGKLTVMDVDSMEYWQSDIQNPYPDELETMCEED